MTNRERWANWYAGLDEPAPYGNSDSYKILADWVADCDLVEDWGCGKGWMRTLIPHDRYRGIDGTRTRFSDEVCDLRWYRSDVDGIVMRHVLEHDHGWRDILEGALTSFRARFGLALFTPLQDTTRVIDHTQIVDVPDIGFAESDLTDMFEEHDLLWQRVDLDPSPTKYKVEHIYLIERVRP